MTVEQLIEELQKIEDKTMVVEVPFLTSENWCYQISEINLEEEGKVELYSC